MTVHIRRSRPRPKTESKRHPLPVAQDEGNAEPEEGIATPEDRPRTRGECRDAPRPCGFVSCRHHLALDIDPSNGSIKHNHPDGEPWGLTETCSLDVAERGEASSREIGRLMNVSRARVDQIVIIAIRRLRRRRLPVP